MFSTLTTLAAVAIMAVASPQVDQAAPGFTGTTSDGATVSLSEFKGQKVILEWTNHDCPYVRKHYGSGNMQMLQKKAAADGIVWLSVISSAPGKQGHVEAEEANDLTATRKAAPAHVVLDPSGDIGRLYAAKTTPHVFIIDEAGVLRYNGAIDSIPTSNTADIARADNYVTAALERVKAGQPVVVKQTRPYGCSVKY